MTGHQKQMLINFSIAGFVPVVHLIYGTQLPMDQAWAFDPYRGGLILLMLVFGVIGGIVELNILKKYMRNTGLWFFLSFLATAGHLILFMAAMKYFGVDMGNGNEEQVSGWLVFAGIFFTFYFFFELLMPMLTAQTEAVYSRILGWNDLLLMLYASFGSVYVWDVLLSAATLTFQNGFHFLFTELLPAAVLFILIILPFKRYFIVERKLLVRTKGQEWGFYLSYLLVLVVGLVSKIGTAG
jgi:hypothetical protein